MKKFTYIFPLLVFIIGCKPSLQNLSNENGYKDIHFGAPIKTLDSSKLKLVGNRPTRHLKLFKYDNTDDRSLSDQIYLDGVTVFTYNDTICGVVLEFDKAKNEQVSNFFKSKYGEPFKKYDDDNWESEKVLVDINGGDASKDTIRARFMSRSILEKHRRDF